MEGRDLWSGLPVEVKVMIFDRMPKVKELISLKLVCKDWNFAITRYWVPTKCPPNPCAPLWGLISLENIFKDRTTFHVTEISVCTFDTRRSKPMTCNSNLIRRSVLALPPPEDCKPENFRDCCNGFVLFGTSSNSQYYVGNPVTRQRFDVPASLLNRTTTFSSLVFDPSIFVCDNIDPFFKIVSLVRPAQEASVHHPMQVDIYTSDKAEWCIHAVELEPHLYGFNWLPCSLYFNRALYYLSKAMYLVCIDNIIPVPNSGSRDVRACAVALPDRNEVSYCGCIGNCYGRVYYSNRNVQGSSILVWMLRNSTWVLMHTISISQDIGRHFGEVKPNSRDLAMEIINSSMESVKKHDCFRPRLLLYNNDDNHDGMTIFIGPKAFLAYNVKTRMTDFQLPPIIKEMWVEGKMKLEGERFFPFSPCPMVLKSPGTSKVVPISAYEAIPESTWNIIPPDAFNRLRRANDNDDANANANGSRINFFGISCAVGFIYCIASFLIK